MNLAPAVTSGVMSAVPPRTGGHVVGLRAAGHIGSPTLYQRMLACGDARFATQLGRLRLEGIITDTDVEAAELVGRTYGWFERLHGLRRSSRSPAYEVGVSRGSSSADEADDAERAERAFGKLQDVFPPTVPRMRDAVEALCVEDRHVGPSQLGDARIMLALIADRYGLSGRAGKPGRDPGMRPRTAGATRLSGQPAVLRTPPADREVFLQVQRVLRPDLEDDGLEMAYRTYVALKERERFRRAKVRGG